MSVDDLESRLVEGRRTKSIIGAFYDTYNHLSFGFLESVYVAGMEKELIARGHKVLREVAVRVSYKGDDIAWHRLDMLVDDRVVVEVKAGEHMPPRAELQLLNYLRATNLEVGLLFHFGPKPRFYRVFNSRVDANPPDPDHPTSPKKVC